MKRTLNIENIKCGGCVHTISKLVNSIEGVSSTEVEIETGQVTYEADQNMDELVHKKLKAAGYPKQGEGNLLDSAKSYVSCAIGKVTKDD